MSANQTSRQLIICGFHRSGTSLTMQALYRAGLRIGDKLVSPTPANPDGHFEDRDIVALHNDILAKHNRSWDSPGAPITSIDSSDQVRASQIIEYYNESASSWGFKDPRTCLFLEWWHSLLEFPASVLIYRDYISCYQSLRVRQAQQLALNPQFHQSSTGFWVDPNRALQLWLDHNRAMLSYLHNHQDDALLISHGAMLEGFDLVSRANERFGLSLDASKPSGIRSGQSRVYPPLRLASEIPATLLMSLNETQAELDELCMVNTRYNRNWIYAPQAHISRDFDQQLTGLTRSLGFHDDESDTHSNEKGITKNTADKYACETQIEKDASVADLIQRMQRSLQVDERVVTRELVSTIVKYHPEDVTLLINAGKTLIAIQEFDEAERRLLAARALAPNNSQILLHLALLNRSQGNNCKASLILKAAYALNLSSAGLLTQWAQCLHNTGRVSSAIALVAEGLERFPGNLPLQTLAIKLQIHNNDYHVAAEQCSIALNHHADDPALWGLLSECLQHFGDNQGSRATQQRASLLRLQKVPNYRALIRSALEPVKAPDERQALQDLVLQELGALRSTESDIASLIQPHSHPLQTAPSGR